MIRPPLRVKLFLLVAGTVFAFVLSTLFVVNLWVSRQTHRDIFVGLQSTRSVFEDLQRTRAAGLLAISHLLAKDFAFRDAVATYDPDTVLSAALNFQERVKSDVVLVTDERGTVLALSATSTELAEDLSTWPAVRSALTGEESVTTGVLGGRIYQTVSVPLRAGPDLLGTLSLGFEISDSTAEQLKEATRSEITFVTRSGVAASSWTPEARAQLARALRDTPESPGTEAGLRTITINGERTYR